MNKHELHHHYFVCCSSTIIVVVNGKFCFHHHHLSTLFSYVIAAANLLSSPDITHVSPFVFTRVNVHLHPHHRCLSRYTTFISFDSEPRQPKPNKIDTITPRDVPTEMGENLCFGKKLKIHRYKLN